MKKFVDMYGYERNYYCPNCADRGFFRDDLSGGESYCTCEAGQNLRAEDSYLACEASLAGPDLLAEEVDTIGDIDLSPIEVLWEIERLEDDSLSRHPEEIEDPNSWNS